MTPIDDLDTAAVENFRKRWVKGEAGFDLLELGKVFWIKGSTDWPESACKRFYQTIFQVMFSSFAIRKQALSKC